VDIGQPTPDAALDVDHPLAGDPQRRIEGRDRISDVVAEESTVGRLSHSRVHAHVGGDTGEVEVDDPAAAQLRFQRGVRECAVTRFVDDEFRFFRRQLGDEVVAELAPDQEPAERPDGTDRRTYPCAARRR
jgi:hypothetical protein